MRRKGARVLKSVTLAAGLLVLPVAQTGPVPWVGAEPAFGREPCKVEIEVCSEIDLVVWKGKVCVRYCW